VKFLSPHDGDFFTPGEPIPYRLDITDTEDGAMQGREGEFSVRTLVSSAWATADGKLSDTDPGLSRMKQSDCFNCHAVDLKIVGPSLLEIANKYKDQPGAVELSVERVIKGSTGVWGPLPMLPHSTYTADEIHMMVKWIYSLAGDQATPTVARGIEGQIVPPKDGNLASGIIEATFTDLGRAPAGPLSGKAAVKLRSRRIEAEKADSLDGPKVQGKAIGSIAHGQSAMFAAIPLGDVGSVKVRASAGAGGGKVEVRSGAVDGPVLGTIDVAPTGAWDKFVELETALAAPGKDRADVYLVFVNPGKGGLMNVDWVEFGKAK
jgi:cytochrome c